jgi:hypothetical protein
MKNWRCLLVVLSSALLIVALCGGGWQVARHTLRASLIASVESRFETLPPDDKRLRAWLLAQPGVVPDRAWVGRFGPDKKVVGVMFIQVRTLAGDPPFPNLDDACRALGYDGQNGPFRDCEDKERSFSEP